MTDIAERLRGPTIVTQYDSAGRLETYEASPSQLDLDAAEEIERLRTRVSDLIGALRASSGALTALLHYRPGDLDDRPEPERQAWWAAERIVRAQMETR